VACDIFLIGGGSATCNSLCQKGEEG